MTDFDFIDTFLETHRTVNALASEVGREKGVLLGVVSNREDPLNMGRIKCFLAPKGTKTETDWLMRVEPWGRMSSPVPEVGTTVTVEYIDGDPHKGIYSGVLTNQITPAWDKDGYRMLVGPDLELTMLEDTICLRAGKLKLTMKTDGTFSFTGASSGYINQTAKQITTLGAVDSDGEGDGSDRLVSKGW